MAEFDIGFLGGGQLARMSIQAAQRMGLKCLSLDPGADTPASQIASAIQGDLADSGKVAEVIRRCDHVTLENEFIPAEAIERAGIAGMIPTIESLRTIQDKLHQREALMRAGVPSPRAVPIEAASTSRSEHPTDLLGPGGPSHFGFPVVLKSRFGGYDGRGTRYARNEEEFESYRELWSDGRWLMEEFVPFKRELAVMVYVSEHQVGCFPTMETIQKDHICDLVFPAETDASDIAVAAVEAVGGKGLYGVELFELESGEILVNELAPRPHNTGHYTLDWGGVSQFEQHVRLVMGLPLVPAEGRPTCMANLLGQPGAGDYRRGLRAALENDADVRVHWYGKAESRPGRKMGHLNICGDHCVHRAIAARDRFYAAWTSG